MESLPPTQDINSANIRERVYLQVSGHLLNANHTIANKFVDST